MYWHNVLYNLFLILNMFSLPLLLLGVPILLVGLCERFLEDNKQGYYISSKVFKLSIIGAIVGLLIFLFIPATFI
nr:MAG TPA: hypothetical protein [Bacteriophage sp.]